MNLDVHSDMESWLQLNLSGAFQSDDALQRVATFPPSALMYNSTGCRTNYDFAAHGCEIFRKLSLASPKPLAEFDVWLDFGVGVGRLARMFKGFHGHFVGADIDRLNLHWVAEYLLWVSPVLTQPRAPLPFSDAAFDAVASISVFTHLTEMDHEFYLRELQRVMAPEAYLFLTVCGERALIRAETDEDIREMMAISKKELRAARRRFDSKGYFFTVQQGHLTSRHYQYGNTFINASYIMRRWSQYLRVVALWPAAIHDFQDIVVLQRREP
jgi:ubiquinone/menaquinone biosynthesis C-methylase UbiE